MAKSKFNSKEILAIILGVVWFVGVSFVTAQTEYNNLIADNLADPRGTSTQLESILRILIVVISFMPSGFVLAYPYIKRNFKDNEILRASLLSLGIAAALYVPFGWYNFIVNFGN